MVRRILLVALLSGGPVSVQAREVQSAPAYADRGDRALEKRDPRSAVHYYRQALDLNSSYVRALAGTARAYAALGETERARESYEKALALDPQNLSVRTGLGRVLASSGRSDDALREFRRVSDADPGNQENNFAMGELFEKMGSYATAEKYYKKVYSRNRSHLPSILALAGIRARLGDYDGAEQYMEIARKQSPQDESINRKEGDISLRRALAESDPEKRSSFLDDAYDAYRTADELVQDPLLERRLAILDFYRNRIDRALRRIDALLEGDSSDALLQYLAGTLLKIKGSGSNAKEILPALEHLQRAVKEAPNDSLARFSLEEMVLDNVDQIPPGRELRKKLAGYHGSIADYYDGRGRKDRMRYHIRRALQLDPWNEKLLRRRLEIELDENDYESFLKDLETLVKLHPTDVKMRYRLQEALNKRYKSLPFRENLLNPDINPDGGSYRRSPTRLFIFDFKPVEDFPSHPDAPELLARALDFHLIGMRRVASIPASFRTSVLHAIELERRKGNFYTYGTYYKPAYLNSIEDLEQKGNHVDYIVQGSFSTQGDSLRVHYEIIDRITGRSLGGFNLDGSGKEAIHDISERAARRIRDMLPYRGRLIRIDGGRIFLNLGTLDGISRGSLLKITHHGALRGTVRVVESAAYVSRCETVEGDWYAFSAGDTATPVDQGKNGGKGTDSSP